MENKKLKANNLRTYLVPLLIIVLFFILAGYLIISNISKFLINNMIEDSNRLAEVHTDRLLNSINANKMTDKLLEERLLGAANRVIKNYDNLSNELLAEISEDLNVDKIYWYSGAGEIVYSGSNYIGWKARQGDPEYDFMLANKDVQIDPIRPDVDSSIPFKYGYKKISSGEFVQVGILAENIYNLTRNFCPQVLVNSIIEEDSIIHAYYLNKKGTVVFCDDETYKAYDLDPLEERAINENRKYYTRKFHNNIEVYEALMPIYNEGERVGTLILFYSLESTKKLIRIISLVVLLLLLLVFLTYGYMAINVIRKNRKIERLAYLDRITSLYNKEYLIGFLQSRSFNLSGKKYALLVIKWQGFNLVKMVFGQNYLEGLLLEIRDSLIKIKINRELIFKYSEDVFCIYVENYKNKDDLVNLSNKIVDSFDGISAKEEYGELISSKVGILEMTKENKDVNSILKYIDRVLEKIEERGSLAYGFFDETIQRDLALNEKIERELRKEIHNGCGGFYLLYQPQVDLCKCQYKNGQNVENNFVQNVA